MEKSRKAFKLLNIFLAAFKKILQKWILSGLRSQGFSMRFDYAVLLVNEMQKGEIIWSLKLLKICLNLNFFQEAGIMNILVGKCMTLGYLFFVEQNLSSSLFLSS